MDLVLVLETVRVVVEWVVVRRLLDLAGDPAASPGVRARVEARLVELRHTLERRERRAAGRAAASRGEGLAAERAHREMLSREIARFLDRRDTDAGRHGEPPPPPPGQPIGGAAGGPPGGSPASFAAVAGGREGATGGFLDGAAGGAWAGYGRGVPPTLAGCSWDE